MYCLLYDGYINKISGKEILVTISLDIESMEVPFTGFIVLDMIGKNHKSLNYSAYAMQRIKKTWDGTSGNFNYSFKTLPAPENCFKLKVYLWNKNKQPYIIRDGKLSAYYYN